MQFPEGRLGFSGAHLGLQKLGVVGIKCGPPPSLTILRKGPFEKVGESYRPYLQINMRHVPDTYPLLHFISWPHGSPKHSLDHLTPPPGFSFPSGFWID